MATLRAKFRVAWDDQEPVEIKTSARDLVNTDEQYQDNPALATFAMIHAALVRLEMNPPPLEEFIDVVDEVEQIGTVVDGVDGPTPLAASDGAPSPLPARPAATSAPSLPEMMTAPS